jgi:hypothetical protein
VRVDDRPRVRRDALREERTATARVMKHTSMLSALPRSAARAVRRARAPPPW